MPILGSVYTKSQCLHIIKTTTRKGSGERAKLIAFMCKYECVPSKTGLYKVLHRDEMGIQIKDFNDDSWGMFEADQKQQFQGDPHIKLARYRVNRHGQLCVIICAYYLGIPT